MVHLINGRTYFGRIFVSAGIEMPKPSEIGTLLPNWRWPTKQDVQSGKITWYELAGEQGPLWWFNRACANPCPGESGDCRVPWPGVSLAPECSDIDTANPDASFNRVIPGTITGESRDLSHLDQSKQDYLSQFDPPPVAGDPGAYQDMTPYDRTYWFTSEWTGATGDYDLTYVDSKTGAPVYVYDLYDEDGVLVLPPPEMFDPGYEFERLNPSVQFERKPDVIQYAVEPPNGSESSSSSGWWIGGLAVAAGIGAAIWWFRKPRTSSP